MPKTIHRALRASAFFLLIAAVPSLIGVGLAQGWGLAEYEAALGISGLLMVALFVLALGGKVGPGGGRPAISGDEVGRQG